MAEKENVCNCSELLGTDANVCPLEKRDPGKIRTPMPKMTADERIRSFDEVECGFDEELAVREAMRCLRCEAELCVGCKICAEVCPDACIDIKTEETPTGVRCVSSYTIDASTCMFCGLCTEACPTRTLTHSKEYELSIYRKEDMTYSMKDQTVCKEKESEQGKVQ